MKRKTKPAIVGATDAELNQGIGYLPWIPPHGWNEDPMASRHTEARQGAAAMRSRAFLRSYRVDLPVFVMGVHPGAVQQGQALVAVGHPSYVAAWSEEVRHGCPAWKADPE